MLCLGLGGCGGDDLPATVAPKFDNGVTAGSSSLAIPYSPGGYVTSADWYFPNQADGAVAANGVVWLQGGDTASLSEMAAKIAGQTNSIVVVPVINSFEIPSQPGLYLGSPEMQKAVADMMRGERVVLATSAAAAGYQRVLPQKFLLAGERLGGGFAAEVAGGTVDNGASANLLGVVMFDGLANADQFPASLSKLDAMDIPLYQIALPPQAENNWGSTTEQLLAFHPDQFFGVQLDNGSAMSAAAITLATGWINDMYRGHGPTDPLKGIYGDPNDGSINVQNSGKSVGPSGPEWSITGSAVPLNAFNTRLNVSFSGEPNRNEPGNYWILDYAPDYSWMIVGDANGTSGTILTRQQLLSEDEYNALLGRAYQLGVRGTITPTAQYPSPAG